MKIARKFDDIEKVRGLGRVLLDDNGRFVNRKTVEGVIPDVTTVAEEVLREWQTIKPCEAYGGKLLAALRHDLVNAADIAEEFASQLVPESVQSKIVCVLRNSAHMTQT